MKKQEILIPKKGKVKGHISYTENWGNKFTKKKARLTGL